MVAGRLTTGYTIERQQGDVLKIEVIGGDVITAVTGASGVLDNGSMIKLQPR